VAPILAPRQFGVRRLGNCVDDRNSCGGRQTTPGSSCGMRNRPSRRWNSSKMFTSVVFTQNGKNPEGGRPTEKIAPPSGQLCCASTQLLGTAGRFPPDDHWALIRPPLKSLLSLRVFRLGYENSAWLGSRAACQWSGVLRIDTPGLDGPKLRHVCWGNVHRWTLGLAERAQPTSNASATSTGGFRQLAPQS
jgi:hypothetical protein